MTVPTPTATTGRDATLLTIIGLVYQDVLLLGGPLDDPVEQLYPPRRVVVSPREGELGSRSVSCGSHMSLRGGPAPRAYGGLPPVFFGAPAPFRWVSADVLSRQTAFTLTRMMPSLRSASKTPCGTPFLPRPLVRTQVVCHLS